MVLKPAMLYVANHWLYALSSVAAKLQAGFKFLVRSATLATARLEGERWIPCFVLLVFHCVLLVSIC